MQIRRRKKLIRPRLQLRMIGAFLGLSVFALLLQVILLGARLSHLSADLGTAGLAVTGSIPRLQLEVLGFSMALLLPLTLAIGVLITFRVAGPIQRFEIYLREVRDGRQSEPCRLRLGDDLQEFCDLLNEATAPLVTANRERNESAAESDGGESEACASVDQRAA